MEDVLVVYWYQKILVEHQWCYSVPKPVQLHKLPWCPADAEHGLNDWMIVLPMKILNLKFIQE